MIETRQHGTKTTAIIKDCAYDAIRIILRRHPVTCTITDVRHMDDEAIEYMINDENFEWLHLDKAVMQDCISATVKVQDGDTFDAEEGKKEAIKAVASKYRFKVSRALERWYALQLRDLNKIGDFDIYIAMGASGVYPFRDIYD